MSNQTYNFLYTTVKLIDILKYNLNSKRQRFPFNQ